REQHRPRGHEAGHPHQGGALLVAGGGGPSAALTSSSVGSSSTCEIQSRPRRRWTSGLLNSWGPRTTVGMGSKLWGGGGEVVVHSSVPTFQGLAAALGLRKTLAKKFTTKRICDPPRTKPNQLVQRLSGARWRRNPYWCGSHSRRGCPA